MNYETKEAIGDAVEKTVAVAEEAVKQPAVRKLARLGFYTKGFLYIVIGSLAIMLVAGVGGQIADLRGALAAIAAESYGKVLLIVFVVGALAHGLWNILRGAGDVDNAGSTWQGIVKRGFSIGIGIFYLGLAASTIEIILAARVADESSNVEETFVAILMAIPLGAVIVVVIGLGLIGAGVHECYSGISGKYRENYRSWEITGFHLSVIIVLGVLSFTARAVLLLVMGYFFVRAAYDNNPGGAIGLDVSLLAILSSTYGRLLVLLTAIGLVSHGVLAFYEARYRRIC